MEANYFGKYATSNLMIIMHTEESLRSIENLGGDDLEEKRHLQRTFFHEYTHFLQNITSGFGLHHFWRTYDQPRQVVYDLRKHYKGGKFEIPFHSEEAKRQEILRLAMRAIEGSDKINGALDDRTATVIGANSYLDDNYSKIHPDSRNLFINLEIRDADGRQRNYHFGEQAVSETMAYLMEKKFYGENKLNNFPYEACQKLCEYIGVNFNENEELLFALCDVSLLTTYPGYSFYLIAETLRMNDFIPVNGPQMFDVGLAILKQDGWNIWADLEEAKNGCITVLGSTFPSEFFGPTISWLTYLLDMGFQYRMQHRHFMIDLYTADNCFEGEWRNVNAYFGTPLLRNAKYERFFTAPTGFVGNTDNIEPIWLLSVFQLSRTLLEPDQYACQLRGFCKKARIIDYGNPNANPRREIEYEDQTTIECGSAPWFRANQDPLCAFGAIWRLSGLPVDEVEYLRVKDQQAVNSR